MQLQTTSGRSRILQRYISQSQNPAATPVRQPDIVAQMPQRLAA